LKSKRIAKGGSIVYMSSINGLKVGSKAHSVYSATKAGIAGFAMSLANEVANIEIRVNTVAPGTVQTSMLEKTAGLIGDESFKNYLKQYPLGIGSPSSLVPLIIFLLDKNSSSWITGQSFIVDGGYTLN
jgi:NAD(P)-dependent dehydrogenase (short-subunit alcohol dehydrogenase family)